jgi:DnaK suppressor protein
MTNSRNDNLKQMLEARRNELQRNLAAKLSDIRASDRHGSHPGALDEAEASDSDLQQEISVSLTEMAAEALRRVDDALARLSSGVYGVCADCNGDIPQQRLAALPFAVRCRGCEELQEPSGKRSRSFAMGRVDVFSRWDADARTNACNDSMCDECGLQRALAFPSGRSLRGPLGSDTPAWRRD